MKRTRGLLAALVAISVVSTGTAAPTTAARTAAAPTAAAPTAATPVADVVLTPVASGFTKPVQVTHAPDGSNRLYVVEQYGAVRIVKDGTLLTQPFIDISHRVTFGGERGLLGIAFHPKYAANGKFYLFFSRKGDGAIAINEYQRSSGNPDVATRSALRRIITIAHSHTSHYGGRIAFGRDGYLYIATGDGAHTGDPTRRAQNLDKLLGKMLRINVNGSVGARQYRIPKSNPFVGKPGRNELWSYGLRNPWGWSFDRATGDLWIADVGQKDYEEVDRSLVSTGAKTHGRGVNYGWNTMEASHCYRPATGCTTRGLKFPVVEYGHDEGCSVIGGFVYRGAAIPPLQGQYVFGDYCSGEIWTIPRTAVAPATKELLSSTTMRISAFGEDGVGELYVLDIAGGALYRIDPAPPPV